MTCSPPNKYFSGHKMENKMGGACSACGGEIWGKETTWETQE